MTPRPKLNIELSLFDKLLEIVGWATLLLFLFFTFYMYSSLPETIPTHYDFRGYVDGYGKKATILINPIMGIIIFIVITALNKFPQIFNYPTEITEENALHNYTMATRMLRVMKFFILLIFFNIEYTTYSIAIGEKTELTNYFTPITLVLSIAPVIYYSFKLKKK